MKIIKMFEDFSTDIKSEIMECFYDLEDDGYSIEIEILTLSKREISHGTYYDYFPETINILVNHTVNGKFIDFSYNEIKDYLNRLESHTGDRYKINTIIGYSWSNNGNTTCNIFPSGRSLNNGNKNIFPPDQSLGLKKRFNEILIRIHSEDLHRKIN